MVLKECKKIQKKSVDKEHIVPYNTNIKRTLCTKEGGKMKELTFKELRLKKKLTQEQVAQKSGFSKDYISMIERGERNPSDKAKNIFAEIFEVPVVQIFLAAQRTISTIKEEKKR